MFHTRPEVSLQFPRFSCIFPRLAAASLQFPRQTLTLPCNSRKTQKPENLRTQGPEVTQSEPCTGMTRPDLVSQCGQVPPQNISRFLLFLLFCSLYLVLLCSLNHLSSFHVPSVYLPCSCFCFLWIL